VVKKNTELPFSPIQGTYKNLNSSNDDPPYATFMIPNNMDNSTSKHMNGPPVPYTQEQNLNHNTNRLRKAINRQYPNLNNVQKQELLKKRLLELRTTPSSNIVGGPNQENLHYPDNNDYNSANGVYNSASEGNNRLSKKKENVYGNSGYESANNLKLAFKKLKAKKNNPNSVAGEVVYNSTVKVPTRPQSEPPIYAVPNKNKILNINHSEHLETQNH
jgi:hypothetical protein